MHAGVVAPLNYLAPMDEPLRTWAFDPPDGGPRFNGRLHAVRMPIADARPRREQLSLDREGFVLCDHASALDDFDDDERVRTHHYAEAAALLREVTGAAHVVVFDHTRRRRPPGRPPVDGMGGSFGAVYGPVGRVHADFTPASAAERMRRVLGDAEAAARMRSRWAVLGLWRPTNREPLLDAPLALADARSVAPEHIVANELIYADRRGETCVGLHHPAHRWNYFPRQRRDEVVVFKNHDSGAETLGVARIVPHTAFDDPQTPPDAPLRESIELRAFVFY